MPIHDALERRSRRRVVARAQLERNMGCASPSDRRARTRWMLERRRLVHPSIPGSAHQSLMSGYARSLKTVLLVPRARV